ncbi:MAG TPA: hypothetical protein VL131_11495 [Gammaproteobacteria bacterium]|jgi:hypothetical protein|nr:hypothetical protein [Gammaproteobacteria bacterium]
MSSSNSNAGRRLARRLTQWLFEEWVWDGLLGVLAVFAVIHVVFSPGIGPA